MTPPIRPLEEADRLRIVALERRLAALERTGSGNVCILAASSANDTLTATATPGTAISGLSITVTQPGRYRCLAIFDMAGSATGWSLAFGGIIVNGVEPVGRRAILGDTGAAVTRACVPVCLPMTLNAGDVVTLGAWKNVAAGTIVSGATTHLVIDRTGPI